MQVTKCESSQLRKLIFPGTHAMLFRCSWVAVLLVVPPFQGMIRKQHGFREKMDFFTSCSPLGRVINSLIPPRLGIACRSMCSFPPPPQLPSNTLISTPVKRTAFELF